MKNSTVLGVTDKIFVEIFNVAAVELFYSQKERFSSKI